MSTAAVCSLVLSLMVRKQAAAMLLVLMPACSSFAPFPAPLPPINMLNFVGLELPHAGAAAPAQPHAARRKGA